MSNLLIYVSSIVVLLPLIIGFILWRGNGLQKPLLVVFYCLCFVVSMEILEWGAYFFFRITHVPMKDRNSHFLTNIHIFFEFFILAYAYYSLAKFKSQKTIITLFMLAEACLLLTFDFSSWKNFNHFNSIANSVASLSMIAILFMYFYNLLQTLETKNILKEPWFWISAGALFYYSGVLFAFIFSENILFSESDSYTILWNIYYFFIFVFRIFLAIGLWLSKTQNSLNSSSKSVLQ